MDQKRREREFLNKPRYYGGPLNHLQSYFEGRLEAFREEHPDFDCYLKGTANLVKKENNEDLQHILRFLEGNPKTNWVSPKRSLFTIFVKLYNYCYSSRQTLSYIKKSLKVYKKMLNASLKVTRIRITSEPSRFDGLPHKFIEATMESRQTKYWYTLKFCENVESHGDNSLEHVCDLNFDIEKEEEIYEDALYLFEYQMDTRLLNKLFDETLTQLKKKGIIEGEKVQQGRYYSIRHYEITKEVGNY